jgi:Na+/melibiose symporter-like transporter
VFRRHAELYSIVLVSLCFMALFSAFNSLQNYATSLLPGDLGKQSLTVLYVSVAVTVFSAPAMVHKLGTRTTLIIGAWLYVAYMASLIHIVPEVVLAMSVVIGFGAAILWVALGVHITEQSQPNTYGRNTGIFWAIFQVSQV